MWPFKKKVYPPRPDPLSCRHCGEPVPAWFIWSENIWISDDTHRLDQCQVNLLKKINTSLEDIRMRVR